METIHSKQDIRSIDNRLLVRAGGHITKQLLAKIASADKNISYIAIKKTAIASDIQKVFNDPRYSVMLSPKRKNNRVFTLIKKVLLPDKVVFELLKIKKDNPYTYHHILIISVLATTIALDKYIKHGYDARVVAPLGLIHDIGKSRIAANILDKRTPLTIKERDLLRTHPFIGYILLHYYYGKWHSKYEYASFEHHERLDGSGYPRKIRKMNRYAQLIAVIDVLDALTSIRPYRKTPFTLRSALDYLLEEAKNGRLNKKIVYLLIRYARSDKQRYRKLKVGQKKRDKPPAYNVYGKIARQ